MQTLRQNSHYMFDIINGPIPRVLPSTSGYRGWQKGAWQQTNAQLKMHTTGGAAGVHKRATVSYTDCAYLGHRHVWTCSDCGAGFVTIHSRPLQLCSLKIYPGSSICRSIRSLAAACPKVARLRSQLKQIAPAIWQSRSHRAQCSQFVGSWDHTANVWQEYTLEKCI